MEHEHRDRATGWKYAKLSGHKNEKLVNDLLNSDLEYQKYFLSRTGYEKEIITSSSIGGLHETNVPGVLGTKTKSKTDLKVYCQSGKQINVSIKKSLSGQVYFVRAELFFKVFEIQFGRVIPENVKRAMRLFWAAADDADEIIERFALKNGKNYDLQLRHHSLNADTLQRYDSNLYSAMLQWFRENIYEITKLSFTIGAVRDCSEWSEFVWYINTLNENNVDDIFPIDDICLAAGRAAKTDIAYGTSNGGTTIQLPFGFVQWHQAQMQFHHNYEKVRNLYYSAK